MGPMSSKHKTKRPTTCNLNSAIYQCYALCWTTKPTSRCVEKKRRRKCYFAVNGIVNYNYHSTGFEVCCSHSDNLTPFNAKPWLLSANCSRRWNWELAKLFWLPLGHNPIHVDVYLSREKRLLLQEAMNYGNNTDTQSRLKYHVSSLLLMTHWKYFVTKYSFRSESARRVGNMICLVAQSNLKLCLSVPSPRWFDQLIPTVGFHRSKSMSLESFGNLLVSIGRR